MRLTCDPKLILIWESHGTGQWVAEGFTKYRMDPVPNSQDFTLYEVTPEKSVPLVQGSKEFVRGFANGCETYTALLTAAPIFAKLVGPK